MSVTVDPGATASPQSVPHWIPCPVTVPCPSPLRVTVSSTDGTIEFAEGGERHRFPRRKRESGSITSARIRMTREEYDRVCSDVAGLIVPPGIVTRFNGVVIEPREPVGSEIAKLATEIADDQGFLRPTRRQARVQFFEPRPGAVAKLYEMLPAEAGDTSVGRTPADNATVRTVFIIGPDKKVKLSLTYPMTTGRNFDEILRALDSIQLTAKYQVATPANWKQGEDVIITAAVSDEESEKRFGGFTRVLSYLRTTPQPRG